MLAYCSAAEAIIAALQYTIEGYHWPVTSPMPLYPEFSLDSLPHVGYGIRKSVAEALFR